MRWLCGLAPAVCGLFGLVCWRQSNRGWDMRCPSGLVCWRQSNRGWDMCCPSGLVCWWQSNRGWDMCCPCGLVCKACCSSRAGDLRCSSAWAWAVCLRFWEQLCPVLGEGALGILDATIIRVKCCRALRSIQESAGQRNSHRTSHSIKRSRFSNCWGTLSTLTKKIINTGFRGKQANRDKSSKTSACRQWLFRSRLHASSSNRGLQRLDPGLGCLGCTQLILIVLLKGLWGVGLIVHASAK